MSSPGQAPQPPIAPGAALYQKMLSAGAPADQANAWRDGVRQKMIASGAPLDQVNSYWGNSAPDAKPIDNLMAANPAIHQATNPLEMFEAGFQMSDTGLAIHGKPTVVAPENASLFGKVANSIGEAAGDAPASIAGFIYGGGAGAAAGAAVPGAGETGASEAIGGVLGAGAGMNALPQAIRETLLDYYNKGQYSNFHDFMAQVAKSTWATAKAGTVGAVTNLVGGKVGSAVIEATAKPWLATGANVVSQAATATSIGAALNGRVPNADDFVAGAVTMLGLHVAGAVAGQGGGAKFEPTEAATRVQHNLQEIYRQTGVTPWEAAKMAKTSPAFRDEILAQDVNGDSTTPNLHAAAPDEPAPFRTTAGKVDMEGKQDIENAKNEAFENVGVNEILPKVRALEGSGDAAISPTGAIGRYQIEPGTARQYGFDPAKLTDPAYNERAARTILTDLYRRFRGDQAAILTAYNAGPGRAAELLKAGPGTQLVASRGPHGWQYEREPANRSEAGLPMETQEYLARNRAMGGGSGEPPKEPPAGGEPPPPESEDPSELTTEQRVNRFLDAVGEPATAHRSMMTGFDMELDAARRIDNQMKTQGLIDPNKDVGIEDMARSTYGSEQRANHFFMQGPLDPITFSPKEGPSAKDVVDEIQKQGLGKDEFNAYLSSLRTIEKAGQGIDTGLFKGGVREAQTNAADPKLQKLAGAVKMFQQWTNSGLEYVRDSGGISQAQMDKIVSKNLAYISLRRVQGDDNAFNIPSGFSKGFRAKNPIARMEGSDRKIIDPWEASMDNMRRMVQFADRNRAAGAVVNAGKPLPEGVRRLPAPEAKAALAEPGSNKFKPYDVSEPEAEALRAFAVQATGSSLGKTRFVYYNNGKPEVYEAADENLARLFRGAESPGEATLISKIGTAPAKLMRLGIVGDPTFGARVALRHSVAAFIADPLHPPPYITLLRGIFDSFGKGDEYWDLAAKGGLSGSMVDLDKNVLQTDAQHLFETTGTANKVWNTVKHPIQLAQMIQDRMSMANRIGYYKRAKGMGIEPFKAAMMARKAYLDFDEPFVHNVVQQWSKWVPFFHADVLGLKQGYAAVKPNQLAKTAYYTALGLVLPQIALHVANYEADKKLPEGQKYSDLPNWETDLNFVTPPIAGQRFRLAKPYNFGPLIGAPVEAFTRSQLEKDPHAFDGLLNDMISGMPLSLPAAVSPLMENVTNHSFFTGKPLIPDSLKEASSDLQYTPATSEPAKALSRLLGTHQGIGMANVSPIAIDNLVRGWTGTVGEDALKALSAPFKQDAKPWEMADIPFVGSFFVRNPGQGAKPIEDFYTDMDKFGEAHNDAQLELRNGDIPAAAQDMAQGRLYQRLGAMRRALSLQRSVIDGINNDKQMSPEEKQQATDTVLRNMLLISKNGDALMQAALKH